jgi:hypothetical protein
VSSSSSTSSSSNRSDRTMTSYSWVCDGFEQIPVASAASYNNLMEVCRLSVGVSVYLSIYLSIHLSIYLSIYPFIYLSIHSSIYLIFLSICWAGCLCATSLTTCLATQPQTPKPPKLHRWKPLSM